MNAEEFRKISAVLNLSQQKLGEKIGVNRQTISRYEKSGVKDIETVRKLKSLYDDHNMEILFGHYPSNVLQEPSTEYETSKFIDMKLEKTIENLNKLIDLQDKEIQQLKRELEQCKADSRVSALS